MPAPLIGITIHPDDDADRHNLDRLVGLIVEGVARAGGLPVLVPLGLPDAALRALYERLDGVLFSGGGDVEAARYGAAPHPAMGGVSGERDRTEFALVRWAMDEARPFFGICRGQQVLNVALGGTLWRDMGEAPGAVKHTYECETEATLRPHAIQVQEETLLARLLGRPVLTVNSLHHQAVRDLAPRLVASARAPDGIVEAVEVAEHPFGLAVQWHPECLLDAPEMRGLFEAFVRASSQRPRVYLTPDT